MRSIQETKELKDLQDNFLQRERVAFKPPKKFIVFLLSLQNHAL